MPSHTIRRAVSALLALAGLAMTGCAALNVSSYLERGVDLRQYRTYNWGPPDGTPTGDPRLDNNRFFDERVRGRVEMELETRGFEKATSDRPDVLVYYHVNVTQEVDVRELDKERSYCAAGDCRPYVFDKGTLFVDLVEPRSDRLIWRGWAEGSIDGMIDNQAVMESRIDAAVTRILEQMPRPVRPSGLKTVAGSLVWLSAPDTPTRMALLGR